jgi:Domain of unknown function (DUF4124)
MKTRVLLLGCLLALSSQAQTRREVYEWKDADGVKHYSDYPQPGARKLVLNGAPTTTSAPKAATTTAGTKSATQPTAPDVVYNRVEIWSPQNGATYFETDSVINIRIRSEPEVGPTHRLLTYLDGKLLPGENATEHSLTNVERGVHSVTSVIVSRDGKELIRSEPVVFHMKQMTVTNPRNLGPAVRPPQPKGG